MLLLPFLIFALAPRRVSVTNVATKQQSVTVVPFRLGENAIIVDTTVNGKDLSLMLDTGFGGAVDVQGEVDLGKPTGSMVLRDFVRETQAPTVHISSLMIGKKRIDAKGMDAVITEGGDYSFAYGTHCDGLIGFETLRNDIVEISFQTNRLIFYPKTVNISERVPDNKRSFLVKMRPSGRNAIHLQAETADGKAMNLALDTGNAFYATTHRDVLERVGLWDGRDAKYSSSSGVASGSVDSWSAKMPPLTIFGVPVALSVWDIIDLPSSSAESDGTVGFGFLKNFNIIIDFGRRYVWLDNFTGVVGNEVEGETGISCGYSKQDRSIQVYRVSEGTPAEKAGVKVGDEIVSLDGVALGHKTGRQMRSLLKGPLGSRVKLTLSRNGSLRRVELVRVALVNEAKS